MPGLTIRNISKTYGSAYALRDVSLDVDQGQFVCLLGPSGCGKSTLLRILAGLETPGSGTIGLGGQNITAMPAHKRDFGMVFQSLALFPHLTVGENIAYPLKLRGASRAQCDAEVERLLDLVHLPGVAGRAISQLSGGQRQRIAIARALALKPKLFLLDEPMSALDAKLREAMQVELKRLQRELGITTFLVTHDQREALTTADQVVLMSGGVIQQVAPPVEIYKAPVNAFVADFIGVTNLLQGETQGAGQAVVAGTPLHISGAPASGTFTFSIRPEEIDLRDAGAPNTLSGTVSFVRHLGASVEISVSVPGLASDLTVSPPLKHMPQLSVGDPLHLHIPPAACVILG
ncbi:MULTISPECIES: ABC transporter ATP-binding protein [unclassified Pannonibacter]|uniref:ABC transporter ATP-binding protein n=1 Tax=unclassified Pannonibacter TaxID=2627228 RepID=UPI0016463073|nr:MULTISPECIES: ABC transporter ATP-binding protein [unclassified Pannonibacter]